MTEPARDAHSVPSLLGLLERDACNAKRLLPSDTRVPARLLEHALFGPVREAASRPGREFRARLLELCHFLAGGSQPVPIELSACVEALHLGSLIVDDIEDDSSLRRGAPALHRIFGVPMALNAGNWLYFYPGSALLAELGLGPRVELLLRQAIDRAVAHCHIGQALDLSVRVTELRQREVAEVVHATTRLKTGALMELSAELGALAASADEQQLRALQTLGRDVGLALQMLDDLTGITAAHRSHKGHEDLLAARPTWVWSWLAAEEDDLAYQRLRSLLETVVARELHPEALAGQLRERLALRGREAIRAHLNATFASARRVFGESPALLRLSDELTRLERYDG